jgi:hypothetical protein
MRQQPFASPEEALKHHGVKGMRWGVRKEEETSGRDAGVKETSGIPSFEDRVGQITRTDKPQVLGTPGIGAGSRETGSGRVSGVQEQKSGMTREQKMLLAFGAVAAAGAGYYAYNKYVGSNPPPFGEGLGKLTDADKLKRYMEQDQRAIEELRGLKLPKDWDISSLKDGPISTKPLGMLGHGNPAAQFDDIESLVINTSRGYADFLPKDGFSNPYAKTQHDSMVRVLEEMREKYPSIRNMNIELAPMSAFSAVGKDAQACVLPMGRGEARLFYNDMISAPTQAVIRQNKSFLPGLGKKDYIAYHEIGHLFAVAHGDLPPAGEFLSLKPNMDRWNTRSVADPLLHRRTFVKHGFSFRELSRLSQYGATEPAEAMAELIGHYFTPEMRSRLTPDQITRAEAMINEMGGLS